MSIIREGISWDGFIKPLSHSMWKPCMLWEKDHHIIYFFQWQDLYKSDVTPIMIYLVRMQLLVVKKIVKITVVNVILLKKEMKIQMKTYIPVTLQNWGAPEVELGLLGKWAWRWLQKGIQSIQQEEKQQMRHTACCSIHAHTISPLMNERNGQGKESISWGDKKRLNLSVKVLI